MATRVIDEQFWSCELKANSKEAKWVVPNSENAEFKLFVNQATLGVNAKENERNVVELTTKNGNEVISCCIVSLRCGLLESTSLASGFTEDVTFKLLSGSGPVFLSGSVIEAIMDDSDFEDMDDDLQMDEQTEANTLSNRNTKYNGNALEESCSEDDDDNSDSAEPDEDEGEDDKSDSSSTEEDSIEADDSSDSDNGISDGSLGQKKLPNKTKGIMKSKNKESNKGSDKQVKFQIDKKPAPKPADINSLKQALSKVKSLPKTEQKFINFLKSNYRVTDEKLIKQAWAWTKQNTKK